ncbi:MAG: Piwi domain-containing protein [Candidatus Asgardarchaeia archaeon]
MSGMELLYTLKKFHENNVYEVEENALKVLYSSIMKEEIEDVEFMVLLGDLHEKGFINKRENKVSLTDFGYDILISLMEDIPKSTIDEIDFLVNRYVTLSKNEKLNFLENLKESIKGIESITKERINVLYGENLKKYNLNAFYIIIEEFPKTIFKFTFKSRALKGCSNEDRYRFASRLSQMLIARGFECSLCFPKEDCIIVITTEKIKEEKLEVGDIIFSKISEEKKPSEDYLFDFIEKFISNIVKNKGFTYTSQSRYINFNKPVNISTEIGYLKRFFGFKTRIERLPTTNKKYLLWLDPTARDIFLISDYINYLKAKGFDDELIKEELKKTEIRVLPRNSSGKIKDVIFRVNVKEKLIENLGKTMYEFWLKKYNIELTEVQPILRIELNGNTYEYPAQVVYIDKEFIEEKFPNALRNIKPAALNPDERYRKTVELIDVLSGEYSIGGITFKITSSPLTLNELVEVGYVKSVVSISNPLLKFNPRKQGDSQENDARAVFKYGPYSGEKTIEILCLLYPFNLNREIVNDFISKISNLFNRYNFGMLKFDNKSYYTISPDIKWDRIDRIVKQTPQRKSKADALAIVILPNKIANLKFRVGFKAKFAKIRDVPTQIIIEDTIQREGKDIGIMKHIVIQLYSKLLEKGEAIWLLDKPADDVNETVYVGLGFSRSPKDKREANSFAALCDARGLTLEWRPVGVPFQGKYITKDWFEQFIETFLLDNLTPNTRRVVIYRREITQPKEIENIKEVLREKKNLQNYQFEVVSVVDDMRRLYSFEDGNIKNPESGIFLILNENEALGYISLQRYIELKQGTFIPVRIAKYIGKSDMDKTIKEYYDLRCLNWSAPITLSKFPFVLNIANKMAEMVKENPESEIYKWLPT